MSDEDWREGEKNLWVVVELNPSNQNELLEMETWRKTEANGIYYYEIELKRNIVEWKWCEWYDKDTNERNEKENKRNKHLSDFDYVRLKSVICS